MLEHMVFKGTPDHPNVPKALSERGAQFNGTTSDDRTNYFETLTASDDNLEFAIRLEADRLLTSFIRREDLVKEMLRPMLKSWLDDNLPQLVERIVKAEIERVSRGR